MTQELFSLRGKIAVVTGATGLLGRQHCTALGEAGASVVVTDLDGHACAELASALLVETGAKTIGHAADVTQDTSVENLRDRILREYGRIDILVNNAGINDSLERFSGIPAQSRFEHFPLSLWKQMFEVNVTGMFLCAQVLGSVMAAQGSGSIINIASTYGVVAPDQSLYRNSDGTQEFYKSPAYPATKGAVIAFTRYLAAYWGGRGVRVNSLSPGGVLNGQGEQFQRAYAQRTPLGRMAQPTEYRGAIVFLASDASHYMTGANLIVDGGWTIW